jgi:phosphatidate cytidylyltransferase
MNVELLKRLISSIILLPLSVYFVIEGSYKFTFLIIVCLFISIYEWQKMILKNYIKILGILFLFLSFYTIFKIRTSFNNEYFPFLLILLICILTDIGGYVFGKIFKGPKLIKFSPNKTYAGMFGSYFLCIVCFFVCVKLNLVNINNIYNFLIFIFLVSSVSQLGDLVISLFKRLSKIKDTGKIIPGHGGLLDRIDGMIFAFPFSYFLLINFNFNIFI